MSASVSEGAMNEDKLIVHIAENGRSLEINCHESTTVESIMRYVESVSGIAFNDQLVLCLGTRMKPSCPLVEYKLPSEDKDVFVFNRARLQINSLPPPSEEAAIHVDEDRNPSPISRDRHPLDEASDPALKALPSYERQFRFHYQRAHGIYCRTVANYENCERFMIEQKVQEKALVAGRVNLEQYFRGIQQSYNEFIKRYTQQNRFHFDLLTNFTRYIDKLRSVKLHPSLQTSSRHCLLDFIKEESVGNSLKSCDNSHRQFEKKVSEFKQMFGDVKHQLEELLSWKPPFSIKNLELTIRDNQRFINEEKTVMQSLSKDLDTVKKLIEDCLSSQLYPSLRPHDAVSALGPMYDVHDKTHLPKMQACCRSIAKLLEFCVGKKNEMNRFVHGYMQRIAYISYVIKDVKLQFPVFKEAMMRQENLFSELKVIRGVGASYRACLSEVIRRKASKMLYMGYAGQLAEKLAAKRDGEILKREEFLKGNALYIPKDVFSSLGLFDAPSQCEINIASFDDHLLNIDMSELHRYAPESLAGFPSRPEVEETVEDEDDLDALDEIAGTSKLELENAKLKAELASAIAILCSLSGESVAGAFEESKTAEALALKDDYAKRVREMLKEKQDQCAAYEKRILELEEHARSKGKTTGEICLMDELSCTSTSLIDKFYLFNKGTDENMIDSSLTQTIALDSSMLEPSREKEVDAKLNEKPLNQSLASSSIAENTPVDCDIESKQIGEIEEKLHAALQDNSHLSSELQMSRKLLEESQSNLAHLESCLHEAREEAQTHLCASDRRASEYRALRESAVNMHSLFERFRKCVYASQGLGGFVNELRALSSSIKQKDDDASEKFRNCMQVLSRDLEKFAKVEALNEKIMKELEEKDMRYREKQKQVKEEMIRVSHIELQEKAAFVLTSEGHYEAISKKGGKYYLSAASVALYKENVAVLPRYIIGLVVHIERQVVKAVPDHQVTSDGANPYGLPIGCEYFVVTIAMIPDTSPIRSLPAS